MNAFPDLLSHSLSQDINEDMRLRFGCSDVIILFLKQMNFDAPTVPRKPFIHLNLKF